MAPPVDPTGGGMASPARLQPNLSPNTTSPRGICCTAAFLMTLSPIARKSCILNAEDCSTHGDSFPEPKSLTSATEAASVCLMEIGILTLCDELRQCDSRRRGHCGSPWRAAESSNPNVPRNHDGDPITAQAAIFEICCSRLCIMGSCRCTLNYLGRCLKLYWHRGGAVGFWTDGQRDDRFAFYAMWIMTLIPYLACAALGYVVSRFVFPVRTIWSYAVGLAVPAIILIGASII
jgi:hypothetical protein